MKKRILSLLLAFIISFPLFAASANAVYMSYTPSAKYKDSIYYQNLTNVTLTGSQGADLVAVAASQVGYHEGDGESELGGGNKNGTKNFSEYGYCLALR